MTHHPQFLCVDCQDDTFESGDYYMVLDTIWAQANGPRSGMLCIACLERRLERTLTPQDFPPYPINHMPGRSKILQKRTGIFE